MVTKVTKKVIKKIPAIHVHDVHFKIKFKIQKFKIEVVDNQIHVHVIVTVC